MDGEGEQGCTGGKVEPRERRWPRVVSGTGQGFCDPSPAATLRQRETTRSAILVLGRVEGIDFMNSPNSVLDKRPIDLAAESEAGRALVERALRIECGRLE